MAVVEARTLDVDALNDAAAVLWDEAHGRGARVGEERARTVASMEHCERLLDLALGLANATVRAVESGADEGLVRHLAQLVRMALARTPQMVDVRPAITRMDATLLPTRGIDRGALSAAGEAIREAHDAAKARQAELAAA